LFNRGDVVENSRIIIEAEIKENEGQMSKKMEKRGTYSYTSDDSDDLQDLWIDESDDKDNENHGRPPLSGARTTRNSGRSASSSES
jgi:hypothetical protein